MLSTAVGVVTSQVRFTKPDSEEMAVSTGAPIPPSFSYAPRSGLDPAGLGRAAPFRSRGMGLAVAPIPMAGEKLLSLKSLAAELTNLGSWLRFVLLAE